MEAEELHQHISAVFAEHPTARIFGFRGDPGALERAEAVVSGVPCLILPTDSELELRHAMLQHEPGSALVFITSLSRREISLDLLARIHHRFYTPNPWESVRALFHARSVDGRLGTQRALGRALLRAAVDGPYRPVRAGVLTEEDAWPQLLARTCALTGPLDRLDTWALWAIEAPAQVRALLHDDELIEELLNHLARSLGQSVRTLFALLHTHREAASPGRTVMIALLGLAAARRARDAGEPRADMALGMLLGELRLVGEDLEVAAQLAEEMNRLIQRRHDTLNALAADLDALFGRLGVDFVAEHSEVSEQGWRRRLELLASALPEGRADLLQQALDAITSHHYAAHRPEDVALARGAAQLAYMLRTEETPDDAPPIALAQRFIESGSFEDAIRAQLAARSTTPRLQDALRALLDRASARRDALNHSFATRLTERLATHTTVPGALMVHEVLDRVIAPLARDRGVLLLVLDGISWGVVRTLWEDPRLAGWVPWLPAHDNAIQPMLAALPTVTQLSRTSLLTGKLQTGGQSVERRELAQHPRLREALAGRDACLFHKREVAEGGAGVGATVRHAIEQPSNGVVAVVINTIDDQLSGADQLNIRWTVGALGPLQTLINLATDRVVVLVGDHGHVWEDRTTTIRTRGEHGERWRSDTQVAGEGEVTLRGAMPAAFDNRPLVHLPTSERTRYSSHPQRGYHGGATLQEVVTPLIVLTRDTKPPLPGYMGMPTTRPAWTQLQSKAQLTRFDTSRPDPNPRAQEDLFATPTTATTARRIPWIDALLLESPLYLSQLTTLGAQAPTFQDAADVLALLHQQNPLPLSLLCEALAWSEPHALRLLDRLQRALSPDGANVLRLNPHTLHLTLDADALARHFQIVAR